MGIFGNLFGKGKDDEWEYTQEMSDALTARLEAVNQRIAEKQRIYGALCDACDKARETVNHLEKVIKYPEN